MHKLEINIFLDENGTVLREGEGRPTRALYRAGESIPKAEAHRLGLTPAESPHKEAPKEAAKETPASPKK